eukprot:Gb_02941 [translate_table: standard]
MSDEVTKKATFQQEHSCLSNISRKTNIQVCHCSCKEIHNSFDYYEKGHLHKLPAYHLQHDN